MRKTSLVAAFAILIALLTPQLTFADVDPIQAALAKVMPELPLPPSHSRLTAARAQIGADWTIDHGYIGQGVSVVLMDGGIQSDHVQFDGRIIAEVCTQRAGETDFIWKCKDGQPISEGMGTGEAVVDLAGNAVWHGVGVSSSVLEFAPGVRIIMIKNGDALQGFDWVIANAKKYNIAAVSMSFGGDGPSPRQSDYCQVADWHERFVKMRALGVIPVAATGNGGQLTGISHPACDPLVVSVGAVTPNDKVISYSNISDRTTLLAPTEFETAQTTTDKTKKDAWLDVFGGTSAATPVAAAMLAVGHSVAPDASIDDLVLAARSTATSIDDVFIKDLKRINFDKFVQKLLNIKAQGSIKTLTTSELSDNSVTVHWTVVNTPANVRITATGSSAVTLPGKDGELVITKPTSGRESEVTVETIESDGSVSSIKKISVLFPFQGLTGWCNPTGKALDVSAPMFDFLRAMGTNKINSNLVDIGLSIGAGIPSNHLACTYIEISPLDSPMVAYISRLESQLNTDRHTLIIPRTFGSGGILRIAFIDKDGNYSNVLRYVLPTNSFDINVKSDYEANLLRANTEIQPELNGILQKAQLVDKVASVELQALGSLESAIAKAKADADAAAATAIVTAAAAAKAEADAAAVTAIAAATAKAKSEADAAAATAIAAATAKAKSEADAAIAASNQAIIEAKAKARADADAAIAAAISVQTQAIAAIQVQIDALKKSMAVKTTITCVKGKLSRTVTGVKPQCPSGYKLKK